MPLLMAVFMASAEFTWNGEWVMLTSSWPSGPSNNHFSRGITGLTMRRQACLSRSLGLSAIPWFFTYSGEAQTML
ncbi:hypothetical protein D9M71_714550 [compost metagenome]